MSQLASTLLQVFDTMLWCWEHTPWWLWMPVGFAILLRYRGGPKRRGRTRRPRHDHKRNIRQAATALTKLKALRVKGSNPALFAFLRTIEPFVFEELILTALAHRGISITRNPRYTGDGGSDGRACLGGRRLLIQAKRYSGHISPQQVEQFGRLCRKQGARGLFVHTGKTGPGSKKKQSTELDIVSGTRLLAFLCGEDITLFPLKPQ